MIALGILCFITLASAYEDGTCRNQTILQTPGDALLTVFVDATIGPYCNESSSKGFQELTTALYITTALNKEDYLPGITLGLRAIDTCQDARSVQKYCLMLAAETDCMDDYYNLGVLAPEAYIPVLQSLQDFTDLPLTFYFNENITIPLVNVAIDFVSRKFETIELLLTDSDLALDTFVVRTREMGICVETFNNLTKLENNSNGLVVAVGGENSIKSWLAAYQGSGKTWLIIPLDDSEPDDIIPIGSFIAKSQSLAFGLEDYLAEKYDNDLAHSPHLFSIGKSIISIAELLSDVHRNNCPSGVCSLPPFETKFLKKITTEQIFDILKIPEKFRTMKYSIAQRFDPEYDEVVDVASYEVNVETFQVVPTYSEAKLNSCRVTNTCDSCVNFKKDIEMPGSADETSQIESNSEKPILKEDYWVPVDLFLVSLGAVICFAIGTYIIYKFSVEDILDGNPTLTMFLIFGTIFLLCSTIPFCLEEDILGYEYLNSRKIFVTTISNGFVFSIMLSRSLFLALSTGGVFTSHINGYLQGLMVFFMTGVQIGMSTIYFIFAPANAEEVLKSPQFIGLLIYDIFLLFTLLTVSYFIHKIARNYHEARCFYFTSIGLLTTWFIWIITFISVYENWRDIVVAFGLIATAYGIISGVLITRVYYMVTYVKPDKTFQGHVEGPNLRFEPRRRTIRQPRKPFYDYVLPMEGVRNSGGLHQATNPNFYGTSSPSSHRRRESAGAIATTVSSKVSGYNNYGYRTEEQEPANHYVVPKVCVVQTNDTVKSRGSFKSTTSSDSDYAQPNYSSGTRENSPEEDCIETEIYIDTKRLSPSKRSPNESYPSRSASPRLLQTEATIDEEDEGVEEAMRVTRF